MRLLLALAIALALFPTGAVAGPGGHLAGNLKAAWADDGGSGEVAVALDPGTAARDAAVARIRSVQHYRTGSPFITEGAHLTALTSTRTVSFPCDEGTSTRSTTFGAMTDPNVPFSIGRPELDVLRGKGHISIEPVWDNSGDPLPQTGLDFFPLPGTVAVTRSFSGCGDSFPPTTEDDSAPIFGTGSEDVPPAVPFGVPIYLRSFEIPLREKNGAWSASGSVHDKVLGSLPIDVSFDLRLVGPMKSWVGICAVPGDKDLAKARTARAAVAIMRKAGFPNARFAGRQPTRYHRRGRYFVDEKFTSSGSFECLAGRPKIFLATSS
jgi:hypothetical protein